MKIEGDEYVFSSGHRMYANRHIVGIAPNLELSEGYDGTINWPVPEWWDDNPERTTLTADDMRELADYMIGLWTKFKGTL